MDRAADRRVFDGTVSLINDFKRYFRRFDQLVLFTTGRGTPFGSFVPTMKISTNTQLAEFKANWIDFNAGTLVEDEEPQAVLERFIGKVLATAGGERLKHEETGFKEIAIFKTGVTL